MGEPIDLEIQVDLEKVAAEIAASQPKWLRFFEPSTEKVLAATLLVAIALCGDLWKWELPVSSVGRVQENQVRVASSPKPSPVPASVPKQQVAPEFLRLPLAVHIIGLATPVCLLILFYQANKKSPKNF